MKEQEIKYDKAYVEEKKLEVLKMFEKNNVRYDADTISAFMLGLYTMSDLYNFGDNEEEPIEALREEVSLIPALIQLLRSEFPDYKCLIKVR